MLYLIVQLKVIIELNGPASAVHQVQEVARRHPHARLQPRPLPRLRLRTPRLRNEKEKTCQRHSPSTQSIVCEICYERTALDAESIAELEKLIPTPKTATKSYAEPRQPYERA